MNDCLVTYIENDIFCKIDNEKNLEYFLKYLKAFGSVKFSKLNDFFNLKKKMENFVKKQLLFLSLSERHIVFHFF